jgi:hypothetical protein
MAVIVDLFASLTRSWIVLAFLIALAPATVRAQTRSGSVDLRASVSKTVALSLAQDASPTGVDLNAFRNDGALTLIFSGGEIKSNLQVAILIRSNTAYNITASVRSEAAMLTQLRVLNVEATGKLVAADAVTGVSVRRAFDERPGVSRAGGGDLSTLDASVPFTILGGPRISLGGGLDSPQNALKVILLLSVQREVSDGGWTIALKLQGNGTDAP